MLSRKGTKLPISVKTRLGRKVIPKIGLVFVSPKIDALTVHGRTAKRDVFGPCPLDEIAKAVKINTTDTVIIGNGDVKAYRTHYRAQETGVDGIMIGRAIFENPWCFSNPKSQVLNPKN